MCYYYIKNDDPYASNNCMPVSSLNVLLNVFEKVMYDRLVEILQMHEIIVKSAICFRKLHSSYKVLIMLFGELITPIESDDTVFGIS